MVRKKVVVFSLGGSLIIPEKIDYQFLNKFKRTLRKYYQDYKFVIVCGGGSIARKYIEALRYEHRSEEELSQAGIRATRMNAMFLMQFFGKEANNTLPKEIKEVESNLHNNAVVICGALRYEAESTSDTNAAKLANHFKTEFINLTNVDGLYTADPRIHKNASLITKIKWGEFEKIAQKIKHQEGQHFVLDQKAATLIKNHKIKTFITGKNLKNLERILLNKPFKGTIIEG